MSEEEKKVLPIIDSENISSLQDIVNPDENPNRIVTININKKEYRLFLDTPRYSDKIIQKKAFRTLLNKAKEDGTLESNKAHVEITPLRDDESNKKTNDYVFYSIEHNSADLGTLKLFWKDDPDNKDEEEKPIDWKLFNVVESNIIKGVYIDRKYLAYSIYADYEHYEDDLYRESYIAARTIAMIFAQTKYADNHSKRFFKTIDSVDRLEETEMGYLVGCYTKLMIDEEELKNSSDPQKSEEDNPTQKDTESDSSVEKSGD